MCGDYRFALLQGTGLPDAEGGLQVNQSEADSLRFRVEALEKELVESENTHRLR